TSILSSLPPIFFLPAPAPTNLYTLSLHDALPILRLLHAGVRHRRRLQRRQHRDPVHAAGAAADLFLYPLTHSHVTETIMRCSIRSEEHTFELQSRENLVCRLLLEKKK